MFAALALIIATCGLARAQPTGLQAVWDNNATEMRAKKDMGGILIDAVLMRDGREVCTTMLIRVKPAGGGWLDMLEFHRVGTSLLGKGALHGSFVRLPPKRYEIAEVQCGGWGSAGEAFSGPFARFEVRAGEFVDLGVLRIDMTGRRIDRVSVTAMSPQARAQLKERMPKNFGFMQMRHMTAIAPKSATPAGR
jgi:hypothetical protein